MQAISSETRLTVGTTIPRLAILTSLIGTIRQPRRAINSVSDSKKVSTSISVADCSSRSVRFSMFTLTPTDFKKKAKEPLHSVLTQWTTTPTELISVPDSSGILNLQTAIPETSICKRHGCTSTEIQTVS